MKRSPKARSKSRMVPLRAIATAGSCDRSAEALRIYQSRGTVGLPVIQAQSVLQRILVNSGRHDRGPSGRRIRALAQAQVRG